MAAKRVKDFPSKSTSRARRAIVQFCIASRRMTGNGDEPMADAMIEPYRRSARRRLYIQTGFRDYLDNVERLATALAMRALRKRMGR